MSSTANPPDDDALVDTNQAPKSSKKSILGLGIGPKLYLAFAGAVSLTLVATMVGWFSMDEVANYQEESIKVHFPQISASLALYERSASLIATIPSLIAVNSQEEKIHISRDINKEKKLLIDVLEQMRQLLKTKERRSAHIYELVTALSETVAELNDSVDKRLALESQSQAQGKILRSNNREINAIMTPAIDDQMFFMVTGLSELGEPPVPLAARVTEDQFIRYRSLLYGLSESNRTTGILEDALIIQDSSLIDALYENFESSAGRLQRAIVVLTDNVVATQMRPYIDSVLGLGQNDDSIFELRRRTLREVAHQVDLVQRSRFLSDELENNVESLILDVSVQAEGTLRAVESQIRVSQALLLLVNVFSIILAFLISWLYVGRRLIARMTRLSKSMHIMASGDLDIQVQVEGNDEVAAMAQDLEVFRRHAYEIQRLHLVENLANELRDKNSALEEALDQLQETQKQMVAQEKLASLGQLAAGIAHEIKNPLNFVNNFARLSSDLVGELREEFTRLKEKLNEDEFSYLNEVLEDIKLNSEKINEHGTRADHIVKDMLMHSRTGENERVSTDINRLLDEYVNLAYHGMRGTNPNFTVDIHKDFSEEVGSVVVVAQDLSRAFLNILTNACQAIQERLEKEPEGGDYKPELWVKTYLEDDAIIIKVRDSGTGIPQDIIDQIFNPFFTTKKAGSGTGLGLSITFDIIREHGAQLEVESEENKFTEFTVILPNKVVEAAQQSSGGATPPVDSSDTEETTPTAG